MTTMEKCSGASTKNTSTNRDVCSFLLGAAGIFQYWQITFKHFLLLPLRNKPLGLPPPTQGKRISHHHQLRRSTTQTDGTGNLLDLLEELIY